MPGARLPFLFSLVALVAPPSVARADDPPRPTPPVDAPPDTPPDPAPPSPSESLPPSPTPSEPRLGRLVGRVFERGSLVPIVAATVTTATGETITTDDKGYFVLNLPPGEIELIVTAPRYEPLRAKEKITSGTALLVDYRLLEMPNYRGRYRSVVRGEARHEGERFTLREEEVQKLPGSSGNPFAVISMLPGVATPIPLLPAYVIRGASPGMNGFFLDGMRVPQLFHFMLQVGGGVVHPRMVDQLDFYPGAYDATFGHYAGGIIDATTRPGRSDALAHGEVQVSVFDLSGLFEFRLPGGVTIAASGHYGYPGPIIQLVDPRVNLSYWDYMLRADWKGLTFELLGSYDSLTLTDVFQTGMLARAPTELRLTYHRAQLRERFRRGAFDFEAAIVGGIDEMNVLSGQGVRKLSFAWRSNFRLQLTSFLRFQGGIDGELSRFSTENFGGDEPIGGAPDQLGELAGERGGVIAGAHAQGQLDLKRFIGRPATITFGTRVDVYHAGKVTLLGVDPRLLVRYHPIDPIELFAGIGLYQQPPAFPIALPGIDTFALQLGLQRSWQGAAGVNVKLPYGISAKLTGFYQKYSNINDVVADLSAIACTSPPPETLSGVPAAIMRQVAGNSFGLETLLRVGEGRVTGWIAYTLSRSERLYSCGLRASDFDQTHVLNVVVQVRLPWRLMAGLRFYVATGRPFTQLDISRGESLLTPPPRNNARLPDFVELDLRIDREWIFRRWAMAIFLEVLNVTYSQSIYGITYPTGPSPLDPQQTITRYDQPQFQGFNWILPSIGIRGRF